MRRPRCGRSISSGRSSRRRRFKRVCKPSTVGAEQRRFDAVQRIGALNNIKADALGVNNTLSTDTDRQAVIKKSTNRLQSLVNVGNSSYKGSFRLPGSLTGSQPFEFHRRLCRVLGQRKDSQQFRRHELSGAARTCRVRTYLAVFLGEVRGSVDLNPSLASNTLVSTINGGKGISPNAAISVTVNNGSTSTTSIVDLSGATTIGDVARLIESQRPSGSNVKVDIVNNGLVDTAPRRKHGPSWRGGDGKDGPRAGNLHADDGDAQLKRSPARI